MLPVASSEVQMGLFPMTFDRLSHGLSAFTPSPPAVTTLGAAR